MCYVQEDKMRKISIFVILLLTAAAGWVQAAEIHVTTTEDGVPGSLRAAITTANTNGQDNTIYLPAGTYGLVDNFFNPDLGGDLEINTEKSLTIIGAGSQVTIIDGNRGRRVIHVLKGTVSISGIAVQNGKTPDRIENDTEPGGGILNKGTLTLNNCIVSNNATGNATIDDYFMCHYCCFSTGNGGGIYNSGILKLIECKITGNTTGTSESWAGVCNYPDGDGGGIFNDPNGKTTLINCSVENNRTANSGAGGIFNSGGTLIITNSTINDNSNGGIFTSGNTFITSCTIYHNTGGGIDNKGALSLTNCTMCNNSGGGINNIDNGIASIKNTIVANNQGTDCSGSFYSYGYNLVKNTSGCSIIGILTGNKTGVDPNLSSLNGYGGPTKTCKLLVGSPAIDAGNSSGIFTDQRSFARPMDIAGIPNVSDGSDIGAYEYKALMNISGKITYNGSGLPGVKLTCSLNGATAFTDEEGKYSFDVPNFLTGDITPSRTGFNFSPSNRSYSNVHINQTDQNFLAVPTSPSQISLNRTRLNFGTQSGGASTSQTISISNGGGGILNCSISSNASWLNCSPASVTDSGVVNVTASPTGLLPGTYTAVINILSPNASNSPQTVNVTLKVYSTGFFDPPFGSFDTPTNNSTVFGSVPVTGWALDNIAIENVKIYRDPVQGEGTGLVYISNAIFVEGARPDVETAFPDYPNNYKAGWGYMLLTNSLPYQGNGTFTIYAKAADLEGNIVTLGSKTILCDNAHAVKPFGAIDTPTQGGIASGKDYVNFGWTLTPLPNTIPPNGSTIFVWVDGLSIGSPSYNQYRQDIATLFPGYNNTNGAVGYYYLDTTKYKNGVHTISWSVKDSAGNEAGIGSRYFTIQNTTQSDKTISNGIINDINMADIIADKTETLSIEIKELERIQLPVAGCRLPVKEEAQGAFNTLKGCMIVGNELRELPIGSFLDTKSGVFYWQPGPGFNGNYEFIFIAKRKNGQMTTKRIIIKIKPYFLERK
jgi:hypothetical protein